MIDNAFQPKRARCEDDNPIWMRSNSLRQFPGWAEVVARLIEQSATFRNRHDLHKTDRRHIGEFCGMKPPHRVRAFIEALLLDVDVTVEVHDANAPGRTLSNAANTWKTDGMIAADHVRQGA